MTDRNQKFTLKSFVRIWIRVIRHGLHTFFGFGGCCRFVPCCSLYASEAFAQHSFFKAVYLTGRRLTRCRPFGWFGWDSVPPPAGAQQARFR